MLGGVASELKPVYLLYGSDRPKIARAVRRLRERMGDDATEHLTAREASGADAVAACNSLGLFVGEGRLGELRSRDIVALRLEGLDDRAPARPVRPRAVYEHDVRQLAHGVTSQVADVRSTPIVPCNPKVLLSQATD